MRKTCLLFTKPSDAYFRRGAFLWSADILDSFYISNCFKCISLTTFTSSGDNYLLTDFEHYTHLCPSYLSIIPCPLLGLFRSVQYLVEAACSV